MEKLLKIGIVGCGAIGSSLAKAVVNDFSKKAEIAALYDIDKDKARELSKLISRSARLVSADLKSLIDKSELVIEASYAKYSWDISKLVITRGRDIMIMSVGGLLGHFKEINRLSSKFKARVYIPTGAICGIDALKAAGCAKINKVTLTTKKPPRAFFNVPFVIKRKIPLRKMKKETLIFEGSAQEAIKAFPQNINVAATLSMAGIGPRLTRVRIIACPGLTRNIHEIEVDSSAGKIFSRTQNVIHPDNPKTSFLAVLSAEAALKQVLSPVRVGT